MTNIINNLNKNYQIIFLSLLLFGLSVCIFLKEINLILLERFDLKIIIIYRILIILFSIYFFFNIQKKINFYLTAYLFIIFLFLYNSLFGQEFIFKVDPEIFYSSINISYDNVDIFFQDKNKIIMISVFNVFLPVLIFSISKNFKVDFKKFKKIGLMICDLFLYSFFIFIIYKFIMIQMGLIKLNEAFINLHSMIYILNIHLILIIDRLKNITKKFNFKSLLNITLIALCFILTKSTLHVFLSLTSIIIFVYFERLNIKFLLLFLIIFFLLTCIGFFIFTYFNFENINNFFDYRHPGGLLNALYVRIMNIDYFLFYTDNLNFFIGNKIFINNIYTYPHNIFVDIYICTGIVGFLIFLFILRHLFKLIKFNFNRENLFLLIILIQSFMFSIFSGFLFTNIIFNTSLAACLCLFKEKDSLITENS